MTDSAPKPPCHDKPTFTLAQLLAELPPLPGNLRRVAPTVRDRVLPGSLREAIMLAVAAENRCRVCQLAHTALGRAEGLTPDEIASILADDAGAGRSEGERLALAHARELARRDFASRDEALHARLLEHFDARAVGAIEATARVMNLANRFNNTLEAGLTRALARLGLG